MTQASTRSRGEVEIEIEVEDGGASGEIEATVRNRNPDASGQSVGFPFHAFNATSWSLRLDSCQCRVVSIVICLDAISSTVGNLESGILCSMHFVRPNAPNTRCLRLRRLSQFPPRRSHSSHVIFNALCRASLYRFDESPRPPRPLKTPMSSPTASAKH